MKKYFLSILCILAVFFVPVSCEPEDPKPEEEIPEGTFVRNVDVHFISTLTDAPIYASNNATAINNKIYSLVQNPGAAIVDRADLSGSIQMSAITAQRFFFKAFAFNKVGDSSFEGSVIAYKDQFENFSSVKLSNTSTVSNFHLLQIPVNVKVLADDGTVTQEYTQYKIDLNLNTVRLSTDKEVSSFSGVDGVLSKIFSADENAFAIGTVNNSLYSSLESQVASGGYKCSVTKVKEGTEFTIFFAAGTDKWGLNDVVETVVNGAVVDYKIGLAWK